MAFYVPVGPRGAIFRFGTFLIRVFGGMEYRRLCRQRTSFAVRAFELPAGLVDG